MDESHQSTVHPEPQVDWQVFTTSLLLIVVISVGLIVSPEKGAEMAANAMGFVTSHFGWLYLILGVGALGFSLWLAFGPYGSVVLGVPGEAPEYSELHWVAMMFTAGIGGSLIAWGVAEPIFYVQTPPFGIEANSAMALEWAHMYPLFHWGLTPWAFYAIPAVPIAYMLFVHNAVTMKISDACDAAMPLAARGTTSKIIDVVIVLGIVGGTATSLGLGVPLVSALISELLGIPDVFITKVVVLAFWLALFGASAYRGLKKGIKVLADINMVLVFITLSFIMVAGPTIFILSLSVNSVGLLADNFVRMSTWMDPIAKGGFPEAWTVFYWAWWIAFAPFVALFVGRISRGRTIRRLVLGVMGWGSLGTTVFLLIMGGYAIFLESSGQVPLSALLAEEGMSVVTAKAIAHLPFGKVALSVFTVLSIIFYATSFDSSSYTVASICSRGLHNDQEPPKFSRLIWALALALLAMGLMVSGDYQTVQAATIVLSVPLIPVILMMCYTLMTWLRRDFGAGHDGSPTPLKMISHGKDD
ncbi:MAG: BCCT family betaine/carnitine transporter [Flavobacterium sp.]|jgi:BCCT family betaine/carnitine transporter